MQKKNIFFGGVELGGGVRVDVKEELKFLRKFKKKMGGGWGKGGGEGSVGGQGGCDRRIEVFGKIHKKNGGGEGVGFVGGVRVNVNEELKFL